MEQIQETPSGQTFTSSPLPESNRDKGGKKGKNRHLLTTVLIAATLIGLTLAGLFGWQLMNANQNTANLTSEKAALQTKVDELTKQLADAQKEASENNSTTKPCDGTVTLDTKDNIKDAVNSENYAALEGYMANKVSVIIAASEGMGERTPTQAIQDIEYLSTGQAPWNFSLSEATLANYQTGFYKPYFNKGTYVGRSSDKLVVAFDFDKCGLIDVIFMAADESLLTEN